MTTIKPATARQPKKPDRRSKVRNETGRRLDDRSKAMVLASRQRAERKK